MFSGKEDRLLFKKKILMVETCKSTFYMSWSWSRSWSRSRRKKIPGVGQKRTGSATLWTGSYSDIQSIHSSSCIKIN